MLDIDFEEENFEQPEEVLCSSIQELFVKEASNGYLNKIPEMLKNGQDLKTVMSNLDKAKPLHEQQIETFTRINKELTAQKKNVVSTGAYNVKDERPPDAAGSNNQGDKT